MPAILVCMEIERFLITECRPVTTIQPKRNPRSTIWYTVRVDTSSYKL